MTSKSLAKSLAKNHGLKYSKAKAILDDTFHLIERASVKGEKVTITDFGTFDKKIMKAKKTFHVKKQEVVEIPARYKITFVFCRRITDEVKNQPCYDGKEK